MKKMIALTAALALLSCTLTGCGSTDSSSSEKTAASTGSAAGASTEAANEATTAETGTTENTTAATEAHSAAQVEDAEYMDALEDMVNCLNEKDFIAFTKYMLPEKLFELMLEKNGVTAEEMAKEMEKSFFKNGASEEDLPIEIVNVAETEADKNDAKEFQESLADMVDNIDDSKKSDLPFDPAEYFGTISDVHLITVEMRSPNGKTDSQEFIAYHLGDEGWKFDITLFTYVKKSKKTAANTGAASLSKSITAALTDIDAKGGDVSGKFIISSDSSMEYNVPAGLDREALNKYIRNYFDKVDKCTYFAVCDGGECVYIVCSVDGNKYPGTYPVNTIYGKDGAESTKETLTFDALYDTCKANLK